MIDSEQAATILTVDDEPANLAVLTATLQPYFRVRAVRSGEQALAAAVTAPRPDLILLDIMMPAMDGYQVLERLKQGPETRDIPVIFLTALNGAEDEEQGLGKGAVDYLGKPIVPGIVLARVRAHLALKKARDRLADENAFLEAEVARRVAEKRQIELQLLQTDKMAAIGLLAAGIAHEINNPIGYVASNLEAMERYAGEVFAALDDCRSGKDAGEEVLQELGFIRADIAQLITESKEGVRRVRDIVRDLKTFSRKDEGDWQWADVHEGLDSTLRIVWNELKYTCEVHKEYGDLPKIRCIPSQLNQVFLNLLVNAAQAIETRGDVFVRTGRADGAVWVEVADTGKGISAEQKRHIFEPFFTTKPAGQGTGLGLSLSASIVASHGGRIEVDSEEGKGSRFRVVLPVDQSVPAG